MRTVESWGPRTRIEVLVLRDDVDGADDESAAAAALRRALRKANPRLAETVDVRADYIK